MATKMKTEKMPKGKAGIAIVIGVPKKMATGGMPMVKKDGMNVPAFAADGVGKMAKGGMAAKMAMFEKSGKDVEKKGVKEGSKKDMAMDKKQMMNKGGAMYNKGGMAKKK